MELYYVPTCELCYRYNMHSSCAYHVTYPRCVLYNFLSVLYPTFLQDRTILLNFIVKIKIVVLKHYSFWFFLYNQKEMTDNLRILRT